MKREVVPTANLCRNWAEREPQVFSPVFRADWTNALFIHWEIPAEELQSEVPYKLDLFDGRAFVSVVLFTMRGMRPARSGRIGRLLFAPAREQRFLNFRTYVRHGNETGIYFLAEWISHGLCAALGRPLYGLPYHWGRHTFHLPPGHTKFSGRVTDRRRGESFAWESRFSIANSPWRTCPGGSLDEFLLERYTAFNSAGHRRRLFHIRHPKWMQTSAQVRLSDRGLLDSRFGWLPGVEPMAAHYSAGAFNVLMGPPESVDTSGHMRPVDPIPLSSLGLDFLSPERRRNEGVAKQDVLPNESHEGAIDLYVKHVIVGA